MTARNDAGPDRPKGELTQAAADRIFEERRQRNAEEAARVEMKMLLFNQAIAWKKRVIEDSVPRTASHARLVHRCAEATDLFFVAIGSNFDTKKFAEISGVFEGDPPPSPDEVIDKLRKL